MYIHSRTAHTSGLTLMDVLVGVALLSLVFYGIFGVFRLSIVLIGSNKAKVGALSLAEERMELIRSLPYTEVGVVGGIPAGNLAHIEEITLNNIDYTRRTFVTYHDDPADGLGEADENGITADYKKVKVEISWSIKDRASSHSVVSTITPRGVETTSGGGTLRIAVFDSNAQPVPSAEVRITNSTLDPPIDILTFTNTAGSVVFPGGTPPGSGYHVSVTKTGFSTDKTYSASVGNPNPSPGSLTVLENQTTSGSFAIAPLSTISIRSFLDVAQDTFHDSFSNQTLIGVMHSTEVIDGAVSLIGSPEGGYESEGSVRSVSVSPEYLSSWDSLTWSDTTPASTTVRYRVYSVSGETSTVIPNTSLSGNEEGFISSPVDLSSLATSTHHTLILEATLQSEHASSTPSVLEWTLAFNEGPVPLSDIPYTLTSGKTIGTDASGEPIAKHIHTGATNTEGIATIQNVEWDAYTLSSGGSASGYTLKEACPTVPLFVPPASAISLDLLFEGYTQHSLRISVFANDGSEISGATVSLAGGAGAGEKISSGCGQAFFGGLSSSATYTLLVSAPGYGDATIPNLNISGTEALSVILN